MKTHPARTANPQNFGRFGYGFGQVFLIPLAVGRATLSDLAWTGDDGVITGGADGAGCRAAVWTFASAASQNSMSRLAGRPAFSHN